MHSANQFQPPVPGQLGLAPTAPPRPPAPHLPLEIIESILVFIPARMPLSRVYRNRTILSTWNRTSEHERGVVHGYTVAAFNVVHATKDMLKVFVPRLADGHELILAHPDRLGACLLQRLYLHKFTFPIATTFAVAMQHNRVDILEWWTQMAKLPTPKRRDYPNWDLSPMQLALQAKAWDALDWLAQADLGDLCHGSFSADHLVGLIKSEGEREVQLAALWFRAGYGIDDNPAVVLEAVCDAGNVQFLDAWVSGREDEDELFPEEWMDQLCSIAIAGKGPVIPMLEWMVRHGLVMPNVAEYASREGDVQVLEWWKANKSPIDFLVRDAHGFGVEEEEGEPDVQGPEIEPQWLSELKEGFCLDLAREKGYQHVLDWWMQNVDLLPIPNSESRVVAASASGDVEFLKIWKQRRGTPHGVYDCNEALVVATRNAQVQVLNWWLHESGLALGSGLKFDWAHVVHTALACDDWQFMVHWWIGQDDAKLHLDDIARVINECDSDSLFMLARWDQLGRILPFDIATAMCHAARSGFIDVLAWWLQGDDSADALMDGKNPALADAASIGGQLDTLTWIRAQCELRGVALAYSERALDGLVWWDTMYMEGDDPCCWQFQVVEWWCSSGLELKYTEAAFNKAIFALSSEQVKWWIKQQRLPLPMPSDVDQEFFDSYDSDVWTTGGPRLVHDHWFRTELGYSAD